MAMVRKIASFLLWMGFILSACSSSANSTGTQVVGTLPPTRALTPYQTLTPSPSRPTATLIITIPVTSSPTSTPFLHTITNNDTMLGLAIRYGIPLEALKTANPSVNPNAMTVGSQLVIPRNVETTQEIPTNTPVPLQLRQPHCFKSGDKSVSCIAAIRNDSGSSLENLSAWIGLYDLQGNMIASQVAYAPLDILRPGEVMPMMVYFSTPLADEFNSHAELLTASAISASDNRYPEVEIKSDRVDINFTGDQAAITGEVMLPSGVSAPSQVWVLAVAYDADENILGMRKWKSAGETHFDITVYSLGGVIDHVELLAEVRQ